MKFFALRRLRAILALTAVTVACSGAPSAEKVLLDTDMVEAFDDGIAMLMLARAPQVELLGVTTVVGNTWVEEGTAYALRQLEAVKLEWKVPVAMGFAEATRRGRAEGLGEERRLFGEGHDDWMGAYSHSRPESWQAAYTAMYGVKPKCAPVREHAVDFMINCVKRNPGEVTIVEVGTCGNLAAAVRRAPEIVPLIKRVIYMGGAVFQEGNVTPAAEFNWWFDPEAARSCLRTPFKEQIIVPLDACEKIRFDGPRLLDVMGHVKNEMIAPMLRRKYDLFFADNPDYVIYVWDVIAAAIFVDPTLIAEEVSYPVDVDDQFGLSYGKVYAFKGKAPVGARSARIVLTVDEGRLWEMIYKLCDEL